MVSDQNETSNDNHDNRGRFTSGNKAAVNAGSRKAFRDVIYAATTREDIALVWVQLLLKAQAGNLTAIGMVLDRACGKPDDGDVEERIQQLVALLERHQSSGVLGNGAARLGS